MVILLRSEKSTTASRGAFLLFEVGLGKRAGQVQVLIFVAYFLRRIKPRVDSRIRVGGVLVMQTGASSQVQILQAVILIALLVATRDNSCQAS